MATIRSYTSLEQSKKLAKILPLESADMIWRNENVNTLIHYTIPFYLEEFEFCDLDNDLPCWSLAALLDVLPKTFSYNNHTYQFMYNTHAMFYINVDNYDENTFYSTNENLVDACYELVLKLYELNLL